MEIIGEIKKDVWTLQECTYKYDSTKRLITFLVINCQQNASLQIFQKLHVKWVNCFFLELNSIVHHNLYEREHWIFREKKSHSQSQLDPIRLLKSS